MTKGLKALLAESWTDVFQEPLTLEKIETYLREVFTVDNEERGWKGYVGPLGDGLYQLPYGMLTGEEGWMAYINQIEETLLTQKFPQV